MPWAAATSTDRRPSLHCCPDPSTEGGPLRPRNSRSVAPCRDDRRWWPSVSWVSRVPGGSCIGGKRARTGVRPLEARWARIQRRRWLVNRRYSRVIVSRSSTRVPSIIFEQLFILVTCTRCCRVPIVNMFDGAVPSGGCHTYPGLLHARDLAGIPNHQHIPKTATPSRFPGIGHPTTPTSGQCALDSMVRTRVDVVPDAAVPGPSGIPARSCSA